MNTFKIYSAIVLAAFFASCSSDDSKDAPVVPQTFLVNNLVETFNGAETENREYQYDATNRITQELNSSETITYSWNGAGRITKKTAFNGFATRETIYTYNDEGKLTEEVTRNTTSNVIETRSEYAYFSDRYQQKYYNSDGDLQWIYQNYYSADKKNITHRTRSFSNNTLFDTNTYEYDNKVSVESVAPYSMLPAPFRNANNIIGVIGRDSDNVINYTSETSYTFNELGLPTSSTSGNAGKNYSYIAK